jgi:hypothetical protein
MFLLLQPLTAIIPFVKDAGIDGTQDHLTLLPHMTVFLKGVTGNLLRGVASNGHQQLHMPTVVAVAVAVAVVREASSNAKHQL